MRIPVTCADLNHGRFTKISRALQKLWPIGCLSLMQSQNILSTLLGYRNHHDLQAQAVPSLPEHQAGRYRSRVDFVRSVAWQAFRRYGMNLAQANDLASKLHLDTLDIDTKTSEADNERLLAKMNLQGKQVFFDEANALFMNDWNPKTPQILNAGIPGYECAVLANRQVFRWSRLNTLLDLLPADCLHHLREEPEYAGLKDDGALESRFLVDEIYPESLQTLREAIKQSALRPDMTTPTWLFDSAGRCLGRVIRNQSLAGVIPLVYRIDDDSIFDAMGAMLCGEIVATGPAPATQQDDAPVFMLSLGNGDDLAADIRLSQSLNTEKSDKPDPRFLNRVEGMTWRQGDDGPILIGSRFTECGQDFIRIRTWLVPSDAPIHLLPLEVIPTWIRRSADLSYTDTPDALPKAAHALQRLCKDRIQSLGAAAMSAFSGAHGLEPLAQRIFAVTEPVAFDRFCDLAIDEYLPVRYADDTEDNPDLIMDRNDELRRLTWLGEETLQVAPWLTPYKSTSIGLVLQLAQGEYPGSHYGYNVTPPTRDTDKTLTHLHGYMLLIAACQAQGLSAPEKTVDASLMAYAAQRVVSGTLMIEALPRNCQEIMNFLGKLTVQEQFIKELQSWRDRERKQAEVRAGGRYLYVGSDIPREKPEGIEGMFRRLRKTNGPILATQFLPSQPDGTPL